MSEKDREPGSDAPKPASEPDTQAPAAGEKPASSEGAPPGAAAPDQAAADAAAAAKAEAREKAIAAAKAKAEAAKAAKAAAAAAGGDPAAPSPAAETPAASGDAPAATGGDDAAKAEARAKAVAAAKAKAEAAKAAKAAGGAAEGAAKAAPKHKHEPAGDQPPWMVDPTAPEWKDESGDELVKALMAKHPGGITQARSFAGDLALTVTRDAVVAVASSLKLEHGYKYIVDAAGVDYPSRPERFEIVYHVYNHSNERRVRLRVAVADGVEVPSLSSVWRGASWPEREAYDMYGIRFSNHPDHTRILLWEGFNGFPLRKDFPVEGIDTGSAIYPEYYEEGQGPISGTGTGWKPPKAEGESGAKADKPEEAS
jgi:NADH-quinone oxidoreductase subunit C